MSDLISRAALFNALANCQDKAEIFAAIQAAPVVEVPSWIQVSERMPDNSRRMYLVRVNIGSLRMSLLDGIDEKGNWKLHPDGSVTHWMQLPQPPEGA